MSSFQNIAVSTEEAVALAKTHYGINATVKKLDGEVDFNFRLHTDQGDYFTFKISRPNALESDQAFQVAILNHLATQDLPFEIPVIIPTQNQLNFISIEDATDRKRFLRMHKWVAGRLLDQVNPRTYALLKNWGATSAHLVKALANFDHPAAHRSYKWNPSETLISRTYIADFVSVTEKEIAEYFWSLFEEEVKDKLPSLRKGINYNDAHDQNLLVNNDLKNPTISGVIDFGDAIYTETINELAIACAYAGMYWPDPLNAIRETIVGFHEVYPLEAKELDVLFPLIAARLMITVANAAHQKKIEPDNLYLLVSEKPAWDLLKKLRRIVPSLAAATFREACGFTACDKQSVYQNWLATKQEFAPVIDFKNKKIATIDNSVGSLELGNSANFKDSKSYTRTIERILENKSADIGIGGYGEARTIYTSNAFKQIGNIGPRWRSIHLGTDLWAPVNTIIYAPLAGKVHSFKNQTQHGDYGPIIILEHQINSEFTFYTLYGHLSIDSLDGLEKGQTIPKGAAFSKIGGAPDNGDWPPHLHFQVILNMLDYEGDFPGVAYPEEAATWLSICPDPNDLLPSILQSKLPTKRSSEDLIASRKKHLGKSLSLSYNKPLHIVRGFGQYLFDATGRRYLDTVNNVAHVGHEHPRVVSAAQQQMGVLNTNTRYLHENILRYAESLLATFPPELCVVHFVNSGSEANELAIRMAKAHSQQNDMIAIEVGYHGNTGACIDVSSYKFDGKGGDGKPATTHLAPLPDTYRGIYRDPETAGQQYSNAIQQLIYELQNQGKNIAGFLHESILSCGGQIVLPKGYLKKVYEYVRKSGGVCIADEVQVGFGRVGEKFWGFQLQDVIPEIVTMGKPIGNGHPLAAVVCTRAIAESFANGMEFFNTFGGNPVSCAIGSAVLDVVQSENLQSHALKVGNYLKAGLNELKQKHEVIGDVRGHGFFLGFELVNDRIKKIPAAAKTSYLANQMQQHGILMSTDGPDHNVIKIKPPMIFDMQNAASLLVQLDTVLEHDFMSNKSSTLKK